MVHHEVAFDLLQGIEHNADKNEQRCSSEELCEVLADAEETRKGGEDGYDAEEKRTGQSDARHDGVEILGGLLSGLHTWDESVVALHVLGHLGGTHGDGCIEVGEGNNEDEVDKVVPESVDA